MLEIKVCFNRAVLKYVKSQARIRLKDLLVGWRDKLVDRVLAGSSLQQTSVIGECLLGDLSLAVDKEDLREGRKVSEVFLSVLNLNTKLD